MDHFDILISGGGVAGLTAAGAFGAAGFTVCIVDPAPPVTDIADEGADLRTTAFLQPARDFLEMAGLWDRLAPFATPLQVMRMVDATGRGGSVRTTRDFDAADISDQPFGWNLSNWLLRREMVARLAELDTVDFRPGTGFASMLTRSSGVKVRLSDGRAVQARLIIGADGRGSPVRDAAGIGVRTTRYGQRALTFAVTHAAPHDNLSTEIHKAGGPFTLVPLPDHEGQPCSAVVWMSEAAEADHLESLAEADFNAAATDRSAGLYGPLKLATGRTSWPIISQLADRITAERTALVAEAAHVMPPIGAQGLNTSLKDLTVLLEQCRQAGDRLGEAPMLDAYARARMNDVRLRAVGIDALNRTSMAGLPAVQDLRAKSIGALHDIAPLRRAAMTLGLGAKG